MLDTRYRQIARKIVWSLFAAQCFGSTGFLAAATVTSIVGKELTNSEALATMPSAIYQVGISLTAFGWGYGMDRLGRRGGLSLGLGLGAVGALIATVSITSRSLALLLIGMVLMGAASSALQLARFAAAEVHPAQERGRAISTFVIGGTVSAIFWFLFSGPIETVMEGAGVPELAWPYLVSLVLLIIAAGVIFVLLRPDPRDVGREIASLPTRQQASAPSNISARPISVIIRQPAALVAMSAMIFGQAVMIMLMVITSLHMKNHEHSVGDISKVISAHVIG